MRQSSSIRASSEDWLDLVEDDFTYRVPVPVTPDNLEPGL